jgi:hypothetical protein
MRAESGTHSYVYDLRSLKMPLWMLCCHSKTVSYVVPNGVTCALLTRYLQTNGRFGD